MVYSVCVPPTRRLNRLVALYTASAVQHNSKFSPLAILIQPSNTSPVKMICVAAHVLWLYNVALLHIVFTCLHFYVLAYQ